MNQSLNSILYAEDDPDIQLVGTMALEQVGGFSVTVVNSGVEALTAATDNQPDLILLDMMMPDLDGLSTLKKLRENSNTASIPVIFMTAKVQEKEVKQYYEAGALAVLPKPFDPMTLADQIREIWLRH